MCSLAIITLDFVLFNQCFHKYESNSSLYDEKGNCSLPRRLWVNENDHVFYSRNIIHYIKVISYYQT